MNEERRREKGGGGNWSLSLGDVLWGGEVWEGWGAWYRIVEVWKNRERLRRFAF